MAHRLGYKGVDNVEIVTLLDGDDYLEVRYAVHGSPFLSSAQVDSVVINFKNEVGIFRVVNYFDNVIVNFFYRSICKPT